MSLIVWDDVVAIAPELDTEDLDATRETILEQVEDEIRVAAWGSTSRAQAGARYLAAHLATLTLRQGSAQVLSESVGPMSRTYSAPLGTDALQTTSYGQEYLRRIRLLPGSIGMVV